MQLGFFEILALFFFAMMTNVFVLVAVGLGAYAVFKTRRDSTEPFFGKFRQPEGDASQAGGDYDHELADDDVPLGADVENILYGEGKKREDFLKQVSVDAANARART